MGADYYLIPASIVGQYPWASEILKGHDRDWSNRNGEGRNPTPEELRKVLEELTDYSVVYAVSEDNWQADIRARSGFGLFRQNALLNAVDFNGDQATPHLVCLEGGDLKLNLLIAERISRICGPLFVIPDTGTKPLTVASGADPGQLIKRWQKG